jgi:glycosyltransferase involved in cell wall biosynthesis
MHILLSCYYFSPYRGGEAAVGWKYATGLAKLGHQVTVLYGDLAGSMPMKSDVERYTRESGMPENLTAIHVEPTLLARFIHQQHAKLGLFFLYYPAYRLWQKSALQTAKTLHDANPFDLSHHLTIIGFREPGYLWQLGIPFVWGPINGAALMPWGFIPSFGWRGRYQHVIRNLMNWLQMRLPSRSRHAAAIAKKIWVVTEEDQHMVENIWGECAEPMIETGAEASPDANIRKIMPDQPLVLTWCGIIEARKSLPLVLEALGGLPADVDCLLEVIGDGPERKACEALAESIGLGPRVRWHGKVPHAEAQQIMSSGHVLVHSSVKEGTPHVVLEALACAMPVICHDSCGMGVAVNDSCGIKIPMKTPAVSVRGFREAISALRQTPGLLESLSAGAIERAKELSWENKVRVVSDTYHQIINLRP